MARKRIPQRDIKAALRSLEDIKQVADEIRAQEGNREANAYMIFSDTRHRAGYAIEVLRAAGQPLPDWIVRNWAWLRSIGWHCHATP